MKYIIMCILISLFLFSPAIIRSINEKEYSDKEIYELAVKYDLEHGTHYHEKEYFDPKWYLNE